MLALDPRPRYQEEPGRVYGFGFAGLEVRFWDERRSSVEAHAVLHANGRKEKDHRKHVDAVAASLMLEGYLRSL